MDRVTIYAGQIPLDTDQLKQSQNAMVALAKLSAGVLGTTTIVNGFTCTPTAPAGLNVILTAGEIYQIANLEASTWGSLSSDTHSILKQGIILDPITFGITPPATVGYSQNFLIEVQYQDVDTGSTVLPYFNSASPSVPFSGPANAGTAQNTVRKGVVAAQVKAGIAATTGTQVTPTADAGWIGLFVVTVANGAATITSGNITKLITAPFIISTLPNVPINVLNGSWGYGTDTGTANNYVVSLTPVPASYVAGMSIWVKMLNAPSGNSVINCNGLGNVNIVKNGGVALTGLEWAAGDIVPLRFDGTNFQIQVGAKPTLAANKTIYVNGAIGADTNDGLSNTVGHALATTQAAINLAFNYAPSQYGITIIIAAGTYTGGMLTPLYPGPNITVQGAGVGSTILSAGTSSYACSVQGPNTMSISGVTAQNTAASGGPALFSASYGGSLTCSNTASNACGGAVFQATRNGNVFVGTHSFNGNAYALFWSNFGGTLQFTQSAIYTLTASLTMTVATAFAAFGSMGIPGTSPPSWSTATFTVTGPRYNCIEAGGIDSGGLGTIWFPGSVAGTVSSSGWYV